MDKQRQGGLADVNGADSRGKRREVELNQRLRGRQSTDMQGDAVAEILRAGGSGSRDVGILHNGERLREDCRGKEEDTDRESGNKFFHVERLLVLAGERGSAKMPAQKNGDISPVSSGENISCGDVATGQKALTRFLPEPACPVRG